MRDNRAFTVILGGLSVVGLLHLMSGAMVLIEGLNLRSGRGLAVVLIANSVLGFIAVVGTVRCLSGLLGKNQAGSLRLLIAVTGAVVWSLPPFTSLAITLSAANGAPGDVLASLIALNGTAFLGVMAGTATASWAIGFLWPRAQ